MLVANTIIAYEKHRNAILTLKNAFIRYFLATNGVKQGGVLGLSPVLFCVYGLLTALASANAGCYIGRNYVGALAYADDLVIINCTKCLCTA